jgi:glycine betaine/proline transport system ATP-binding protein
VPRSNVLTLRWIMRPAVEGDDMTGVAVPVETIVRDAVPMVAASDRPLRAVSDGQVVGVVDRVAVLNAFVPQEL